MGPSSAHARAIPSASAPSARTPSSCSPPIQDVASLDQRADQLRRAVGSPQTRAQVRVDHPDPACAVEQRDRCALRARSEHRGDPGDEDRARVFDRRITQVGRVEPARRGVGTQVGQITGAVAEHQAGRTSGIGRDPSQIDALVLERVADPRARVVGAEPADPGHAEAGPRERDACVRLGAAVRGVEGPGGRQGAVGSDQRQHRLAEGEHVEPFGHPRTGPITAAARSAIASRSAVDEGGVAPTRVEPRPTHVAPASR